MNPGHEFSEIDASLMERALKLAAHGEGRVEPNPMVGCVIARHGHVLGEGWHGRFGGPHAEIVALQAATEPVTGATLYVTLEPCCHHGKTPPCTQAILSAGLKRVVCAHRDPFAEVNGQGLMALAAAGVTVAEGLCREEAAHLMAPYLKLVQLGRPWVLAKWAMTLDGKIASRTQDSQWISSEPARARVHQLRGRMDAILVGRRTALKDDPLLTARPPGPRTATRVVCDSHAALPLSSQLAQTAAQTPVLIAAAEAADPGQLRRLRDAGCDVIICPGADGQARLLALLDELGRRKMTNILVEGGGELLGGFLDADQIDEVHVWIAPRLLGGADAITPVAGRGRECVAEALPLSAPTVESHGPDLYVHARVARPCLTMIKPGRTI